MQNPLESFGLSGRVALVTGARREIGRAIELALAAQGARVAVHHRGTEEEASDAESVLQEIRNAGGNAQAFPMDFAENRAGARLAVAVARALGRVDILVLNASIELPEDFTVISSEHVERQLNVNLLSTLELLQTLVPAMAERGWGRVLTIGSIQQLQPHPSMLVYAGTKAAQMNWVLNLARQFGAHGVTVNNLTPGAILTARNREQMAREGEAFIARVPVGRLGTPDDLVGAALLLCSDAGRYITGVNLLVDGGRHIG